MLSHRAIWASDLQIPENKSQFRAFRLQGACLRPETPRLAKDSFVAPSRLIRRQNHHCLQAEPSKQESQTPVKEEKLGDELEQLRSESSDFLSNKKQPKRKADSSDWVSSQLTRRFGIAGGLAWLGVLLFGVVSEQVKTRLENAAEAEGTKDVANAKVVNLGQGLSYQDLRQGGGASVQKGYLTVLHYKGLANGEVFEDTKERGKPLVYLFGGRPFTAGLCLGVEQAMQGMKGGGIRKINVPSKLGFGEQGINLRGTLHVPDKAARGEVPANADLEYTIELIRVSIPPS